MPNALAIVRAYASGELTYEDAESQLRKAHSGTLDAEAPVHPLDAIADRLEQGVRYQATGFARLDEFLGGGFRQGSLVVKGAAPKAGKSTMAQMMAWHHATHGGRVLYYDLENGTDRFYLRLLCRIAKVPAPSEHVVWSSEQKDRWDAARAVVKSNWGSLTVRTERGFDQDDLELEIWDKQPTFVVIDSLNKLNLDLDNRRGAIDSWLHCFEGLRARNGVTILAISELARSNGGYRAGKANFKESGGIEYAGDLLLTLSAQDEANGVRQPATLTVQYNRDGLDGPVAKYKQVFPHFGLDEQDLVTKATDAQLSELRALAIDKRATPKMHEHIHDSIREGLTEEDAATMIAAYLRKLATIGP